MEPARSDFLQTARDILRIVAASAPALPAMAIARTLSLEQEAVERVLVFLTDLGLVRYEVATSGFLRGEPLFEGSFDGDDNFDLLQDAFQGMARLREATGEKVRFAKINGDEIVYLDNLGGPSQRGPFPRSFIGKTLAASLDNQARARLLQVSDEPNLAFELDLIRARGYAIEMNELTSGATGVSAPIVDRLGRTVAAIGLEVRSGRCSRAQLHDWGPAVIEATRGASLRAGGGPRPASKSPRPSTPVSESARPLVAVRNIIGESPVYDAEHERLFWVDMYDPAIWRFDFRSGKLVSFYPGEMVTALALCPEGMLAAAQSNLWLIDPDSGERIRPLGHPEAHIPTNRFNDGKCDTRGRLWVNTMDFDFARNAGSLYRFDPGAGFSRMDTGLTIPNGMGWSPDNRTMYLADSADRIIYAYDFSEQSGNIANRRVFVRVPDNAAGAPDGLAVDANGNLWVAMFDGWRICGYSPDGKLVREIVMPVPRPTSCAFGKDGKTLFVVSARLRVAGPMLLEAPHSGAVFAVSI